MKVGDLARFVKKGFKAKIGDIVLILGVDLPRRCNSPPPAEVDSGFTEAYYHYIHQRTEKESGTSENYLEKIP